MMSGEDRLMALHVKLDEISVAMFEGLQGLPTEARTGGAPHPSVAATAAAIVHKSREFDQLVDDLGAEWTQSAADLDDDLADARAEHEAARLDVLRAHRSLSDVADATSQLLNAMYDATQNVAKGRHALENRAVYAPTVALRDRIAAIIDEASLEGHEDEVTAP